MFNAPCFDRFFSSLKSVKNISRVPSTGQNSKAYVLAISKM